MDISRQENKVPQDRISEVHEQDEMRHTNVHDTSDSDDNGDVTTDEKVQDDEEDYEVNKT